MSPFPNSVLSKPSFRERRLQRSGLRVIIGGVNGDKSQDLTIGMSAQARDPNPQQYSVLAMNTLEAQLEAESWFLEEVRGSIRKKYGLAKDAELDDELFKNLKSRGGHDNLIHIAQFFFFLETLNCTTPSQLEALIVSHNDKVKAEMSRADKDRGKPPSDKFLSAVEITQVRLTLDYYGEVAFSLTELGKLMSDIMSTSTTANLLKELVIGGIFEQVGGPALDPNRPEGFEFQGPAETNSKRKLVRPKSKFIEDYKRSLLKVRDKIRAS